jgi:hypothetical protein
MMAAVLAAAHAGRPAWDMNDTWMALAGTPVLILAGWWRVRRERRRIREGRGRE